MFALRTRSGSESSTESFHREDVPELSEDIALFRSLNQMCQRVAWSARMWNSSIGRFAMNLDEARVYCERLPTALALEQSRIEGGDDGFYPVLSFQYVNQLMYDAGFIDGNDPHPRTCAATACWGRAFGLEPRNAEGGEGGRGPGSWGDEEHSGLHASDSRTDEMNLEPALEPRSDIMLNVTGSSSTAPWMPTAGLPTTLSPSSDAESDQKSEIVDAVKAWAKIKPQRKRRKVKNGSPNTSVTIETEEDVEEVIKTFVAALPEGQDVKTAIMKAGKLTPSDHSLKPGERWCMMDSGAGCNAAKRKKEFPKYQIKNGSKKRRCVLADGTEIRSEGVVEVRAEIEGEEHIIPFDDLPVECPIISVRRIVRKGNIVKFKKDGGYILNASSGRKLRFVERNGVYYIKLKVLEPEEPESPVFSRPGR